MITMEKPTAEYLILKRKYTVYYHWIRLPKVNWILHVVETAQTAY